MTRLFLLACVALGACSFSTAIPDAAGPTARIGFGDATSTADEKSTTHQIKIKLSEVVDTDVKVKYQIEGGTASPLDFDLLSPETITIPAGQLETNLEIRVKADTDGTEADETIDLVLLDPENAQIAFGSEHHEVTIRAKALPRVGFVMMSSSAQEPTDGTFLVELDETSEFEITANYVVTSTNATSGLDYQLANGSVVFAAGTKTMPITLDVLDDTLDEDPENVVVTLTTATNAIVELSLADHTHTILDDQVDPAPNVFFNGPSTALGEAGGTAMVQIRLSAASGRTITVPFSLSNTSSATLTADFTVGTTSPVTIAPGAMTANILVTAVNDTGDEPSETIVIDMGAATNATNTGQQQHTVTITDDDLVCYGAAPFSVCVDSPPPGALTLPATINTSQGGSSLCSAAQTDGWTTAPQSQPAACFILRNTITVNGTVTVTGNRPLVLLGAGGVTINGTIDASSNNTAGSTGPASPSGDCDAFATNPTGDGGGAGGGAGGTFMTKGGDGGMGDGGSNIPGGTAAAAETAPVPKLRAGCNGQRGGNGSSGTANPSGAVGRGGGAVYVVTGGTLTMTANAVINASGSAGSGGALFSGGTGAGSGGMIKLYAATLSAIAGATVLANGGGGAAGGDDAGTGNDGNDPSPATPQTAANGGTGAGAGGGDGFAGVTAATKGNDGGNNKGGGGGGGGGGYIQSNLALTNVTASAGVIQIP